MIGYPMRLLPNTTIILALLITFSFLAVSKLAIAGSADGRAIYCECEKDKACGNVSVSSTVFAVVFESGTVDMKYPKNGGYCGRRICLGGLKQDRYHDGDGYEDGYEEIRWTSKVYFGWDFSLNRQTLLLTETSVSTEFSKTKFTWYKRCEVMSPAQVLEKIEKFISDYNDEIDADRAEKTKKNKI